MGVRVSSGTGDRGEDRFEWPPRTENRDRVSPGLGSASTFVSSNAPDRLPETWSFTAPSTREPGGSKPTSPTARLSGRQPSTRSQGSVPGRLWRKPFSLVGFAICALAVGGTCWYLGQRTPEGPAGTRTNLVQTSATAASPGLATQTASHPARHSAVSTRPGSGAGIVETRSAARHPAAAATGTLLIKSEPAGASITIDGRPSGVTPTTLRHVIAGDHRISLTRGAVTIDQSARVEDGATVTVVASLRAPSVGSGWVAVRSPLELDVVESGELLGTTRSPRIMLQEGQHTLELSNTAVGYHGAAQVRIVSGEVIPLSVALPSSVVHVNAIPWAEVWIDGKRIGETPIGNLPMEVGAHEVLFRHPELGEKTVSTLVKAGVPTRVTADLRVP